MEKKPKLVLTMSRNLGLGEACNMSMAFDKEEVTKEHIGEMISLVFDALDNRVTENNLRSLAAQEEFEKQNKVTPKK